MKIRNIVRDLPTEKDQVPTNEYEVVEVEE